MDKLWKPVALGKLRELQNRTSELKKEEELFSFIEKLEIPPGLKTELLKEPISIGFILPPVPMGLVIDATKNSISRMIEKIRNYHEEA